MLKLVHDSYRVNTVPLLQSRWSLNAFDWNLCGWLDNFLGRILVLHRRRLLGHGGMFLRMNRRYILCITASRGQGSVLDIMVVLGAQNDVVPVGGGGEPMGAVVGGGK